MDRVDVALATYQGARYLPQFLDSVAAQTHPAIRMVASDDNSADETRDILRAFRPDTTITVINAGARGFCGNFRNAIEHTDAPYVALADQDDVWVPHKIQQLLAQMKAVERRLGTDVPVIVCSDLAVVDRQLQPLKASFFARWNEDIGGLRFRDIVFGNRVPGCSMLLNRALVKRAMPIPSTITFHDWWFMLVTCAFGKIEVLDEPLILYRQHGGNQIGLIGGEMTPLQRVTTKLRAPLRHVRERAERLRLDAGDPAATLKAFRDRYAHELAPGDAKLLAAAAEPGFLRKIWRLRGARAPFGRVYKYLMLYFIDEAERRAGEAAIR